MFRRVYTALVTPFRNRKVDFEVLQDQIKRQIKAGVAGIVPVGTTGESPTLSVSEHKEVVQCAVETARGRVKVLAGTGGNSTREAIELTQAAQDVGVDGSLQVAPYYNRPSPTGIYQHFKSIADSTDLPIVLYSIPGRCGVEIGIPEMVRLREKCSNIVGIKEAGGTPDRVSQIRQELDSKFLIFSGDDSLTLPFISVGAVGVISVASNIIPNEMVKMVDAALKGDFKKALKKHEHWYGLFKDLFIDTNPVPIKSALAMVGLGKEECRLPLVRMNNRDRTQLKRTLSRYGLIS
ncbi:MAG TPA: 4-hydroxy-tetrahydrodipicolinate synthase [Verrucomicrobiales bacterium]|nr:4-hydroxy-tetrahydrodipicolinate synthase [Verrucomicrobiales bacterium]